jgi:hypothetical protein
VSIAPNDVNVIAVETNNNNFQAGSPIDMTVRAEVGGALFGTGSRYRVRFTGRAERPRRGSGTAGSPDGAHPGWAKTRLVRLNRGISRQSPPGSGSST